MSEKKHIMIVGAGAWGTALSMALAHKNNPITLIAQTPDHTEEIKKDNENTKYFPGFILSKKISITHDYATLKKADIILWVIPAQYTRQLLKDIQLFIPPNIPFIICSKGIDCTQKSVTKESLLSLMISKIIHNPLSVLSGPNFASEIAQGLPAAATIASESKEEAALLSQALSTDTFHLHPHDDKIGVQIAGSLKNVIAIASGLVLGRRLGQNAQAALLSSGLQEIRLLGLKMGAQSDTFFTLAGMGDFILTCTSTQSRNTSLGYELGQGKVLEKILQSKNSVHEGLYTCKAVHSLAKYYQVQMPIFETVYGLLQGQISVDDAIKELKVFI